MYHVMCLCFWRLLSTFLLAVIVIFLFLVPWEVMYYLNFVPQKIFNLPKEYMLILITVKARVK